MSVGGVLGFENYSTRFNLKNVKIGNRFYRSYRILEKIEFSSFCHFCLFFLIYFLMYFLICFLICVCIVC